MEQNMVLKLMRVREGAIIPKQATAGSAGYDLCACIDTPQTIEPGERCVFPSGLAAEIPAGTVCAASGENAVEYETTEAAVLPAGALTVTAAAQAVLGGRRGNAAKGAVNTLITPPAGIESVTNDVPFTGGADKEDDEALRTRLLRCFYALPNGSNTETYRRAALMTPGVKSVQVVPRARCEHGGGVPVRRQRRGDGRGARKSRRDARKTQGDQCGRDGGCSGGCEKAGDSLREAEGRVRV